MVNLKLRKNRFAPAMEDDSEHLAAHRDPQVTYMKANFAKTPFTVNVSN